MNYLPFLLSIVAPCSIGGKLPSTGDTVATFRRSNPRNTQTKLGSRPRGKVRKGGAMRSTRQSDIYYSKPAESVNPFLHFLFLNTKKWLCRAIFWKPHPIPPMRDCPSLQELSSHWIFYSKNLNDSCEAPSIRFSPLDAGEGRKKERENCRYMNYVSPLLRLGEG